MKPGAVSTRRTTDRSRGSAGNFWTSIVRIENPVAVRNDAIVVGRLRGRIADLSARCGSFSGRDLLLRSPCAAASAEPYETRRDELRAPR
jgi:hypothetical protein